MRSILGILLLTGGLAFSNAALASCPDGSTLTYSVCSPDAGGTTITCNLGNHGGSNVTTTAAVRDTTGLLCDGADYCIWGYNANAENFCYEYTATSALVKVHIVGTAGVDTTIFRFDGFALGLGIFNLEEWSSPFQGVVDGLGGDDLLQGSDQVSASYEDQLHGGTGNDTIKGLDGNDVLTGDEDNDIIEGDDGDDEIYGGDGNDTIQGNDGDDDVYGGSGIDKISGGSGNDFLYGENDTDYVCGDSGTDTLTGDNGNDFLYGGESENGGASTTGDSCEGWPANPPTTACEAGLGSRPANCPAP